MKLAEKEKLMQELEMIIGTGCFTGEEIDITARKVYDKIVKPLILIIDNLQTNDRKS